MLHSVPSRFVKETVIAFGLLGVAALLISFISPYGASRQYSLHNGDASETTIAYGARITSTSESEASVLFTDGPDRGTSAIIRTIQEQVGEPLKTGDSVLVTYDTTEQEFAFYTFYRIPLLLFLVAVFVAVVLLVGRRKGLMSIVGLAASVIIIGWGIIPLILAGYNALLVTVAGAGVIAAASISVAHGFNRRTALAIVSVLIILLLVTITAQLAVGALHLSGLADETSYYLQIDRPDISLSGILAGGIVIAALGALDDIVTTQVAVVDQLHKANPKLTSRELYSRASAVGSEHIIALVNTLALVYAGAALPLLIVYATQSQNLFFFFNSEFVATELARTIIVSIGLVLSVPLSTWIAARYMPLRTKSATATPQLQK